MVSGTITGTLVLMYLFCFMLAVLWFLLPFAVFGVKDRLDTLIKLQKNTNKLLEQQLRNNIDDEIEKP